MGLKPRSSFKSWAFVALDPFEDLLLGPAFGAVKVRGLGWHFVALRQADVFSSALAVFVSYPPTRAGRCSVAFCMHVVFSFSCI